MADAFKEDATLAELIAAQRAMAWPARGGVGGPGAGGSGAAGAGLGGGATGGGGSLGGLTSGLRSLFGGGSGGGVKDALGATKSAGSGAGDGSGSDVLGSKPDALPVDGAIDTGSGGLDGASAAIDTGSYSLDGAGGVEALSALAWLASGGVAGGRPGYAGGGITDPLGGGLSGLGGPGGGMNPSALLGGLGGGLGGNPLSMLGGSGGGLGGGLSALDFNIGDQKVSLGGAVSGFGQDLQNPQDKLAKGRPLAALGSAIPGIGWFPSIFHGLFPNTPETLSDHVKNGDNGGQLDGTWLMANGAGMPPAEYWADTANPTRVVIGADGSRIYGPDGTTTRPAGWGTQAYTGQASPGLASGGVADVPGLKYRPHGEGSRGGMSHFGLVNSATPGRADHVPTKVRRGSYVVPADTVSGLGQGNTLAGSRVLQQALGGHASPRVTGRPGHLASGGVADDVMPVQLSGGEFLITPEIVASIGGGDPRAGAAALDRLVAEVRNHTAATLPRLPGPK